MIVKVAFGRWAFCASMSVIDFFSRSERALIWLLEYAEEHLL